MLRLRGGTQGSSSTGGQRAAAIRARASVQITMETWLKLFFYSSARGWPSAQGKSQTRSVQAQYQCLSLCAAAKKVRYCLEEILAGNRVLLAVKCPTRQYVSHCKKDVIATAGNHSAHLFQNIVLPFP